MKEFTEKRNGYGVMYRLGGKGGSPIPVTRISDWSQTFINLERLESCGGGGSENGLGDALLEMGLLNGWNPQSPDRDRPTIMKVYKRGELNSFINFLTSNGGIWWVNHLPESWLGGLKDLEFLSPWEEAHLKWNLKDFKWKLRKNWANEEAPKYFGV